MAGYWGRPDATAQAIRDGWFHTGDAGDVDEEGFIFLKDRIKDVIISGGENVYPAEVEAVLMSHPEVLECAVIGVPDAKWGETVKAVVVRRQGAALSQAALVEWSRDKLAGFKRPSSIDFIATLPRNAAGKLLKRSLREPYWAGHTRRIPRYLSPGAAPRRSSILKYFPYFRRLCRNDFIFSVPSLDLRGKSYSVRQGGNCNRATRSQPQPAPHVETSGNHCAPRRLACRSSHRLGRRADLSDDILPISRHRARRQPVRAQGARQHLPPHHESDQRRAGKARRRARRRRRCAGAGLRAGGFGFRDSKSRAGGRQRRK